MIPSAILDTVSERAELLGLRLVRDSSGRT